MNYLESASHESNLDAEGSNKKQKLIKGEAEETLTNPPVDGIVPAGIPILDLLPSNMASATRSVAQPLHVGDLRLADLRISR